MKVTRRSVLAAAGAVVIDACAKAHEVLGASDATGSDLGGSRDADSGLSAEGLAPDPDGILDLPPGFSYTILQRTGDPLRDGYRVPERPDGMGCFEGPDGSIVLMCNHEMRESDLQGPYGADQAPPSEAYDSFALGGVTRRVLDAETLESRSASLALTGSSWNCAGGVSPWGWLTCEETVAPGHGFVFLCDPSAEGLQPHQRIAGYGRFRHEAAAVDPETSIAYLTEDRPDACFYRFLPRDPETPFEGVLQALRVPSQPALDTGRLALDARLIVDWVDIDDPTPDADSVRAQAQAKGAAIFRRTEGIWFAGDEVILSATIGGHSGIGQILRLALPGADNAESTLELLVEARERSVLNSPDNLCASPSGALFVAEDGPDHCFVRRVFPDGSLQAFARNVAIGQEIAGPCFSPDGRVLFLNLQVEGLTLAIRGPFEEQLARGPRRPSRTAGANAAGFARLARTAYRQRAFG